MPAPSRRTAVIDALKAGAGMAPPAPGPATLRAPTWREVLSEKLREIQGSIAEQPAVRVLAGLPGEAAEALGLNPRPEVAENFAMGAAGSKRIPNPIKAHHGSPHDFEQFDLSKMGTGEGTAAFGRGMYFAENPNVAKTYRQADPHIEIGGQPQGVPYWGRGMDPRDRVVRRIADARSQMPDSPDAAIIEQVRKRLKADLDNPYSPQGDLQREMAALGELETAGIATRPGGKMYDVNIHATPDELLDFDAPMGQQPAKVKEVADRLREQYSTADVPAVERAKLQAHTQTGSGFYDTLSRVLGSPDKASVALREAGVPGWQYFDKESRIAGKGTRNFVITDTQLLEIAKKYGIPLAVLQQAYGTQTE